MAKDKMLTPLRVSEPQKKKIEARAKAKGMKTSEYLRSLIADDIEGIWDKTPIK